MLQNTQEVVHQCLRNNARAQKQLYDAFAPAMLGVCYRYAPAADVAHEMLQEGFVRVFTKLEQWRGEGELGAWIRRIMVHTALNWLRDNKAMTIVDVETVAEKELPINLNQADGQLRTRDLMQLLHRLPDGYRTVFNLFAIEGYSHAEIAAMLGITESTSRSQYLRARKQLAEWLVNSEQTKTTDYARTHR